MNLIVFGCCGPITLPELHDNVFKRTVCELMRAHESAVSVEGRKKKKTKNKSPLREEDGDTVVEMPLGRVNQSGSLKPAAAVHSAG